MYSKIPYQTGAKSPQVKSTSVPKTTTQNKPQIIQWNK